MGFVRPRGGLWHHIKKHPKGSKLCKRKVQFNLELINWAPRAPFLENPTAPLHPHDGRLEFPLGFKATSLLAIRNGGGESFADSTVSLIKYY